MTWKAFFRATRPSVYALVLENNSYTHKTTLRPTGCFSFEELHQSTNQDGTNVREQNLAQKCNRYLGMTLNLAPDYPSMAAVIPPLRSMHNSVGCLGYNAPVESYKYVPGI